MSDTQGKGVIGLKEPEEREMSDAEGKGLKELGIQVQKGDHYSYKKTQKSETKYNGNGERSSYQSEEKAAVVTKTDKSSTTTVTVIHSRVVETIHHKSLPPAKDKITHFSHPRHALHQYEVQKEDKINCNICEAKILDKAWRCESCKFFIHKSCESIPQKIKHNSHLCDTLTLLSSTNYAGGKFICNACHGDGKGFHYHCSPCKFDIHVACAGLLFAVNYNENLLARFYNFPIPGSETVECKVCDMEINKKGWAYYNEDSKFVAHIYCAVDKKKKDSILAIQKRLQDLQMK